jgi:hypothetical protein
VLHFGGYVISRFIICDFAGAPGVGKSAVTMAIQEFARAWKQPNSVIVAAFTHAASNNARGQTMNSAFNLPFLSGSTDLFDCSPAHDKILLQCRLVIIDEVGQTGRELVALMSLRFRKIFGNDLENGGVDVTLSLDWLQVFDCIKLTK